LPGSATAWEDKIVLQGVAELPSHNSPLANAPPSTCVVESTSPQQLQEMVVAMAEGLMVHSEETCSALTDAVMVTEQADYFFYLHTILC